MLWSEREGEEKESPWSAGINAALLGLKGEESQGEPSDFMGKEKSSALKGMVCQSSGQPFHFYYDYYSEWFEFKGIFSDASHSLGLDSWLVAVAEVVGTSKNGRSDLLTHLTPSLSPFPCPLPLYPASSNKNIVLS